MITNCYLVKRSILVAAALLATASIGSTAYAATVSCPNPVGTSQNRVYQTTGASDCVHSGTVDSNIGQGTPANDAFLLGQGINDAEYGDSGPRFGKTWTTIDSENYSSGFPAFNGLTLSNVDSDSFNWELTATQYAFYALGLKDGGDPKWAVFLLSDTTGLAEIISTGGSWSHIVLYGSDTGEEPPSEIPEPGTLALVALSLLGAASVRRRRA